MEMVKTNNLILPDATEERHQQLALAEKMRKNFAEVEDGRKNSLKRNLDPAFMDTNTIFEQDSVATQVNQSVLDLDFYPSQMQEERSILTHTEPSMLVNSAIYEGSIQQSIER